MGDHNPVYNLDIVAGLAIGMVKEARRRAEPLARRMSSHLSLLYLFPHFIFLSL